MTHLYAVCSNIPQYVYNQDQLTHPRTDSPFFSPHFLIKNHSCRSIHGCFCLIQLSCNSILLNKGYFNLEVGVWVLSGPNLWIQKGALLVVQIAFSKPLRVSWYKKKKKRKQELILEWEIIIAERLKIFLGGLYSREEKLGQKVRQYQRYLVKLSRPKQSEKNTLKKRKLKLLNHT